MKEKTSFFTLGILTGIFVASIIFAYVQHSKTSTGTNVKVLKLAHNLESTHPVHLGLEYMKKHVEKLSNGKMSIDIYSGGSLGSEPKCIEQLKNGSLDMTKASSAQLGMFEQRLHALTLPYIFRNHEHYWKVLNSNLGEKFLGFLSEQKMIGLCFFDAGSRSFYTSKKPIRTPDDIKGLKIRVMNSQVDMETIKAFGGSPTPVSSGETYTAISQGVVDGAENNPPTYLLGGHCEVAKFFTLDEHTSIPDVLVIGERTWKSLSKDEREILQKASKLASVYQRKLWQERELDAIKTLKKKGVEIIIPDKSKFAQKANEVYKLFKGTEIEKLANEIKSIK